MNAKALMIHSAQQDSVWLRLAKGIVRADAERRKLEQQLLKEAHHAEVCDRQ